MFLVAMHFDINLGHGNLPIGLKETYACSTGWYTSQLLRFPYGLVWYYSTTVLIISYLALVCLLPPRCVFAAGCLCDLRLPRR